MSAHQSPSLPATLAKARRREAELWGTDRPAGWTTTLTAGGAVITTYEHGREAAEPRTGATS